MIARLGASMWAVALMAVAFSSCASPRPEEKGATDLEAAWASYRAAYVSDAGFVMDRTREAGEVTSEGQGYALLRAAWMADGASFDRILAWTDNHLRRADGLYSWRWSPAEGGRLLDANSAADADQEIAFALVLAADAFRQPGYLSRARDLLRAIRSNETVEVDHRRWFPAAGNWAVHERVINPSYFLPYAYSYFAAIDPDAGWEGAIDIGYDLLEDAQRQTALVPDFAVIGRDGHLLPLPGTSALSGGFSSDAMRVYWRAAVDCSLHRRVRACADPLQASRVQRLLTRDATLFTRYDRAGAPVERTTSLSFYATVLPYLLQHAPAAGEAVRERLAGTVLSSVSRDPARYYDANWIWFGLAAADGFVTRHTPSVQRIRDMVH